MAKPDLNKILAELDEENIARAVHIPHADRRRQYQLQKLIIIDYSEFRAEIGKYYLHQIGATAPGGNSALSVWVAEGTAEKIIESAYSAKGGADGACQMAQKGIDGGMWPVIDAIYMYIVRLEEDLFVEKVITDNLSRLGFDDKVECMRQFMFKFGYPMSNGKPVKSPYELASKCEAMIKFLTERLRSIRSKVRV